MPVCRWAGCTVEVSCRARCSDHTKAYSRKTNGDDASDHKRGSGYRISDADLAEVRRRLSRFDDARTIARDLGITKSGLFRAIKRGKA